MKIIHLFIIFLLFLFPFINSELRSYIELKSETEEIENYDSPKINEEEKIIDISISREREQDILSGYNMYIFNATFIRNDRDDRKLDQFRFIKIRINNADNNLPRKNKAIYASTDISFMSSQNLYEDCEFKAFNKDDNLILTIPIKKLKEDNKIYIKFPFDKDSNFTIYYSVEDGRRIEGIAINENSCYDILLDKVDEENPNYYRFLFSVNKKNYPLITFTSTSSKNFTCFMTGKDRNFLQDMFVNGYSFIFEYSSGFYEYHTFLLQTKETTTINVCHRVVESFKSVSIGEKMHSTIKNFIRGMLDCFRIEKDPKKQYDSYIMQYITKSKNLKMLRNYENVKSDFYNFSDISGTLFLDSSLTSFCFMQEKDMDEIHYNNIFSSIYFQILGVKDNVIDQDLNAPLINGFAMEQKLKGGQILYYRLNETYEDVNYNKLYFKVFLGM